MLQKNYTALDVCAISLGMAIVGILVVELTDSPVAVKSAPVTTDIPALSGTTHQVTTGTGIKVYVHTFRSPADPLVLCTFARNRLSCVKTIKE